MKDLADLGSHSRNAAKVFAFLRNPVWALQIGATIVTSVQSGLLSARASRALRQLWCDATWWYQKDYEKYRKMILEIRRNWKCKKNCLEEFQTTKLNKHDVWTKVVLDISDLLDVVCFCCIWDLDKSIFGEKNRKHVDKQNDAVCGSSHAEIRILYTPLGDAARGAMCTCVKSFQKARDWNVLNHSLYYLNICLNYSPLAYMKEDEIAASGHHWCNRAYRLVWDSVGSGWDASFVCSLALMAYLAKWIQV